MSGRKASAASDGRLWDELVHAGCAQREDNKTVAAMDVLAPAIGEAVVTLARDRGFFDHVFTHRSLEVPSAKRGSLPQVLHSLARGRWKC